MAQSKTLTILQINDAHAYLEPHPELFWEGVGFEYRTAGGFARLARLVGQARQENPGGVLLEELPEAIRKLHTDERVDLVILLSRLGFPQDMQLAAEAPGGIDVLLSGHTHNRLYRPALVDDTIIQSGSQGSFLGRLDLELSGGRISGTRHRLIEVSADPPANPQAQALVDIALAPFREELGEVVGETAGPLDRGHSLEATFARDPYRQMGGYLKRALRLKAYIKIENPHGQRLQKLLVGGEELRLEQRYTAAFVTEQGVPAQYGEQRQNTPARAIDALRQYLGKRRTFRPELFDTFVVI